MDFGISFIVLQAPNRSRWDTYRCDVSRTTSLARTLCIFLWQLETQVAVIIPTLNKVSIALYYRCKCQLETDEGSYRSDCGVVQLLAVVVLAKRFWRQQTSAYKPWLSKLMSLVIVGVLFDMLHIVANLVQGRL